jgi:predicted nucleic acid-binding protein
MNALDTNILVYAHDSRDPRKQAIAGSLVEDLDDGALLWQVACEFLSASRKLEPFGYGLAQAWQDIQDLYIVWKTILPSWNTLARAQLLCRRCSISHWDALLLSACREAGIARLYSEDLDTHDGLDGLEIVNPFRSR